MLGPNEEQGRAFEVELAWDVAGEYVTTQLSAEPAALGHGGELGRWFADNTDLSAGRCLSWVTDPDRIGEIHFCNGSNPPLHLGSDVWVRGRAREYFTDAQGPALWVGVDILAREGEPWLAERDGKESGILFTEKDTYWYLTREDAAGLNDEDLDRVLRSFGCASGGVAFLASCEVETLRATFAAEASESDRSKLVDSIDAAIIKAYDCEGDVIWWR